VYRRLLARHTRREYVRIAAAAAGSAVAPAQQPPAPAGPQVESVRLVPAKPVVGRSVSLVVRVKDPVFAIKGVRVDLGERGGRIGGSACRADVGGPGSPFRPGTAVTIRSRFRFRTAGQRRVSFVVTSGGCTGPGLRFSGFVAVTVMPASRRRSTRLLRDSKKLARAANSHTQDMVRRRYFEHEGPNGPTLTERLSRVRYKGSAGENIAYETGPDVTARSIFRSWMESPPHRANMVRRGYRGGGIGVSKRAPEGTSEPGGTFTADFGTARG
jgi:hypothetical protein